jgi:hypothetical protein
MPNFEKTDEGLLRHPAGEACATIGRSNGMSDCLHCDINELVRERIEGQDNVDLADMVARMAESLAETIMLAPKEQWAALMAEAIRQLGQVVIEEIEGVESTTAH